MNKPSLSLQEKEAIRVIAKNELIVFNGFVNVRYQASWLHREIARQLERVEKGEIKRLQGYFQTYRYYLDMLHLDNVPKLELKEESQWFTNLKKIMLSKPIIVIHIRRGDYSEVSSSIGMLSQDYYLEAIHQIRSTLPEGEFWVFSDDVNAAKKILHGANMEKCTWISPPPGTDAAESLVLMSFGKAIITANSSLSAFSGSG